MYRIHVRVEQANRNHVDVFRQQPVHRRFRGLALERLLDPAVCVNPLGHHDAQIAFYQGWRLDPLQVIEPRHPQVADLQDVAEAVGADQADPRTLQLEDRIGGNRGAVHDLENLGRFHSRFIEDLRETFDNGASVVVHARRHLLGEQTPLFVDQHDVRERAADVHSDPKTDFGFLLFTLILHAIISYPDGRVSRAPLR